MKNIKFTAKERKALLALKDALDKKFKLLDFRIFGSRARGNASPDSDIDVMIELDGYTSEVESFIDDYVFEINLAYDCFISTLIFSREELEKGPLGESPIYKTIAREGVGI